MSQKQCPWCGRLGARVGNDANLGAGWAQPHADGSTCVCRHVDSHSRLAALRDGGRYWDGSAWVCPSCGTAPPATEEERELLEAERALDDGWPEIVEATS